MVSLTARYAHGHASLGMNTVGTGRPGAAASGDDIHGGVEHADGRREDPARADKWAPRIVQGRKMGRVGPAADYVRLWLLRGRSGGGPDARGESRPHAGSGPEHAAMNSVAVAVGSQDVLPLATRPASPGVGRRGWSVGCLDQRYENTAVLYCCCCCCWRCCVSTRHSGGGRCGKLRATGADPLQAGSARAGMSDEWNGRIHGTARVPEARAAGNELVLLVPFLLIA